MGLVRRFLPTRHHRSDAEQAREIIEHALRESRKPKGCAKSAESGADIRDRLLTLVDDIKKETGRPAAIFAADGTLTDARLIEALHKRGDDGVNPNVQYVNESWPATVKGYESRPNSDELIEEKATIFELFDMIATGARRFSRTDRVHRDIGERPRSRLGGMSDR